jgi:hypothetical protein
MNLQSFRELHICFIKGALHTSGFSPEGVGVSPNAEGIGLKNTADVTDNKP